MQMRRLYHLGCWSCGRSKGSRLFFGGAQRSGSLPYTLMCFGEILSKLKLNLTFPIFLVSTRGLLKQKTSWVARSLSLTPCNISLHQICPPWCWRHCPEHAPHEHGRGHDSQDDAHHPRIRPQGHGRHDHQPAHQCQQDPKPAFEVSILWQNRWLNGQTKVPRRLFVQSSDTNSLNEGAAH